ncbi:unnamed protein product [Kuraishia capsulata CBS 1993]|uniref:Uncharacterized protein n=1 Tax=Kuraishia capsulata CBS 1993 TaxID=1382522 RepID=W6MTV4_9ASCO|nr:uncharacterized protein KUCA_T00001232001 [Kuraishia capsulata CBS 1993]CDK25265.1 unnamed protein product [Kuraishia capsulata CBS 1993]
MHLEVETLRKNENVVNSYFIQFTGELYSLVLVNRDSVEVYAVKDANKPSVKLVHKAPIYEAIVASASFRPTEESKDWIAILTSLNHLYLVTFTKNQFVVAEALDLVSPELRRRIKVDEDAGIVTVLDLKPFIETSPDGKVLAVYSCHGFLQVYHFKANSSVFSQVMGGRPMGENSLEKRLKTERIVDLPLIIPLGVFTIIEVKFLHSINEETYAIAFTSRDQNLKRHISYVQLTIGANQKLEFTKLHTFYPHLKSLPIAMVPLSTGGVTLFCEKECLVFPAQPNFPFTKSSVPPDCEIEGFGTSKRLAVPVRAYCSLNDSTTLLVDKKGMLLSMTLECHNSRIYHWNLVQIGLLHEADELVHIRDTLFFTSSFNYGTRLVRLRDHIDTFEIAKQFGEIVDFYSFKEGYVLSEGSIDNHRLLFTRKNREFVIETDTLVAKLTSSSEEMFLFTLNMAKTDSDTFTTSISLTDLNTRVVLDTAEFDPDTIVRDFAVIEQPTGPILVVYTQNMNSQYDGAFIKYEILDSKLHEQLRSRVQNATFSKLVSVGTKLFAFGDGLCYFELTEEGFSLIQSGIASTGFVNFVAHFSGEMFVVTDVERGARITGVNERGKVTALSNTILERWPLTCACSLSEEMLLVGDALGNVFYVDTIPDQGRYQLKVFSYVNLGDSINVLTKYKDRVMCGTSNGNLFLLSLDAESEVAPALSDRYVIGQKNSPSPQPQFHLHTLSSLPITDVPLSTLPVHRYRR